MLIPGRQVDLAFQGAARTLGADAHVMVQREAIVRMFQDGGKGFQKSPGAVPGREVLNVIAHRQTLLLDDFRLLRRSKALLRSSTVMSAMRPRFHPRQRGCFQFRSAPTGRDWISVRLSQGSASLHPGDFVGSLREPNAARGAKCSPWEQMQLVGAKCSSAALNNIVSPTELKAKLARSGSSVTPK